MWAAMSFPILKPTTQPISASVLANSQPSGIRSSAHRNQQQPKNRENQNKKAVTNQLSGLDVLWAMQRAADKKQNQTIRNKKRPESESKSGGGRREEYGVVYSNTRPLIIKEEWGAQLDELEKRLQELSDAK